MTTNNSYPSTLKGIKEANASRIKKWHKGGIEEWSVADWATATMGEAGEMCNAIKKLRRVETGAANINEPGRQLTNIDDAKKAIESEMAGTFIYLDLLAQRLGIDLEQAIVDEFNKKSKEYGFPEYLSIYMKSE